MHLLEGMTKVEGGTFLMGQRWDYPEAYLDGDSILLYPKLTQTIQLPSFYIQSHEVTNAQYREFVYWVRDSIAHQLLGHSKDYGNGTGVAWDQELDWSIGGELDVMFFARDECISRSRELDVRKITYDYSEYNWSAVVETLANERSSKNYKRNDYIERKFINVYPDTLAWQRDLPASQLRSVMFHTYFSNPIFDDYPVVGVSYEQAKAYCHWRTNQLRSTLGKLGYRGEDIEFRLPTEAEWEYAALGTNLDPKAENYPVFPWLGTDLHNDGKYQANFGPYGDENKGFTETEDMSILYTSPIKTFPANNFGLYDMAGNVAEWVLDAPLPPTLKTYEIDTTLTPSETSVKWGAGTSWDFCGMEESELRTKLLKLWAAAGYDTDVSSADYRNYIKPNIEGILQDCQSIFDPNTKKGEELQKVKGGSWINSPYFLAASSRVVLPANTNKAWLGFRVVMSYNKSSIAQEKFMKVD
ncbi:MAG: formylglycine-generating enzyme family protein [Saprospiraceae bacterium]|nr:formylglycine-generating enzyme family protein [Saprospiraceae bacterium]